MFKGKNRKSSNYFLSQRFGLDSTIAFLCLLTESTISAQAFKLCLDFPLAKHLRWGVIGLNIANKRRLANLLVSNEAR